VKKAADKRYCFPGTPADALDFGLWGVLKDAPPDLVISGVNDGPNTGMAQVNSGTVSAAVRSVRWFSGDCRQYWLQIHGRRDEEQMAEHA
jgi:5'-nucleotidase